MYNKLKAKIYREKNKDKMREYQKTYRAEHKDKAKSYAKAYYLGNKQKLITRSKNRYEAKKEDILEKSKVYRASYRKRTTTKALRAEYQTRRSRLIEQATPKWANIEAIRQIYLQAQYVTNTTGILHHVDHIVPLKGKDICGLHIETNLRVIPAVDNISKGNKFVKELVNS